MITTVLTASQVFSSKTAIVELSGLSLSEKAVEEVEASCKSITGFSSEHGVVSQAKAEKTYSESPFNPSTPPESFPSTSQQSSSSFLSKRRSSIFSRFPLRRRNSDSPLNPSTPPKSLPSTHQPSGNSIVSSNRPPVFPGLPLKRPIGGLYVELKSPDGFPTGQGVFRWSDGTLYDGSWVDGQMEGEGTMLYPNNNSYYIGGFKRNKPTGHGCLITFNDSSLRVGEWVDGIPQRLSAAVRPSKNVCQQHQGDSVIQQHQHQHQQQHQHRQQHQHQHQHQQHQPLEEQTSSSEHDVTNRIPDPKPPSCPSLSLPSLSLPSLSLPSPSSSSSSSSLQSIHPSGSSPPAATNRRYSQDYAEPIGGVYFELKTEDGFPTGNGVYRWPDGSLYNGHWENGQMEGQGRMIFPNHKYYYAGGFKANRPDGHGCVVAFEDGYQWTGQWVDGFAQRCRRRN